MEKGESMITFKGVWQKLCNKQYRDHYALSLLKRSVAFQIKTLRKKHCGTQAALAEKSSLKQGVISRAEDQDYGNLTFNTVGRIAAGLDMAFIGKFVPFTELIRFSGDLSEEEFKNILTFDEENAALPALEALGLFDFSSAEEAHPLPIGPMPIEIESESSERDAKPQKAADDAADQRMQPKGERRLHFAQAG
jgi:transcriptional regulator with XRE-family HTH domain